MFRLVLVYSAVFLLCLFSLSDGIAGSALSRSARVTADQYSQEKDYSSEPLFSKFYYRSDLYEGNFGDALEALSALSAEREKEFSKLKNETHSSQKKLHAEKKGLLKGKKEKDFAVPETKWAVEFTGKLAETSMEKDKLVQKMSGWDKENFIEVKYIEVGNKTYLKNIITHRTGREKRLGR